MSDYRNTLAQHRRRTVLSFLAECSDYSSNAAILTDICNSQGISSSRDQMVSALEWLDEQGLVRATHRRCCHRAVNGARA